MQTTPTSQPPKTATGTLGTFAGVFTPSVLTILGIILFLRLGFVTGSAGLGRALLIISLANLISVLTSISLSAIATNLRVKGGGDYYLISRTLGLAYGGAIGIVLYLAQSVSVGFYCIGFAEAVVSILPPGDLYSTRLIALAAMLLLFSLAWLGADWATRFQYGVMALLIMALGSFFYGGLQQWQGTTMVQNWQAPAGGPAFWVIFGVFFPAVTGFTQGVSMSGDLKDPGRSLPLGTFLAVGISIVVYFGVAIVFAGVFPNQRLMEDYGAIKSVSKWAVFIDAGVIAATLSSAMASFLGGPRILQSLAADKIFPILNPFSKGHGKTGNPRRAVLLSATIAGATIALGQLNLVAQIVSMFFLISYGLLNYATYFEARAESPSFRPRFSWFNKNLSLLGCLVCGGVILALDPRNGLVAIAILVAVHHYLRRTVKHSRWADSSRAHAVRNIRTQLATIAGTPPHDRNWYPHILAFTHNPERRPFLLEFCEWIEGHSGFVTAVQLIEDDSYLSKVNIEKSRKALAEDIKRLQRHAYSLVINTSDMNSALSLLMQTNGIGPLRPNTAVVNWYGQSGQGVGGIEALTYVRSLKRIYSSGINLVVLRTDALQWQSIVDTPANRRRIDVWWRDDATSRLALLLAYLMTRSETWAQARIRVLTTGTGQHLAVEKERLSQILTEVRIQADPQIVDCMDSETVVAESAASQFVFLPFRLRRYELTDINGYSLARTLPKLPASALIQAAEDIDLDAEPEEGTPGLLAEAMDALAAAHKSATRMENEAVQARQVVGKLEIELKDLSNRAPTVATMTQVNAIRDNLDQAAYEADRFFRRAAKSRAKALSAAEKVKSLGGDVPDEKSPPE